MLVLNASYEPINVCAARRAIVLVLKGVAMTEEINGHFMHSTRLAMRVPDHRKLEPWRIFTIEGDARTQLGEVFVHQFRKETIGAKKECRAGLKQAEFDLRKYIRFASHFWAEAFCELIPERTR